MNDMSESLSGASHEIRCHDNNSRKNNLKAKERLRKIVETKLRTTMIGEIAKVEQFLGKIWGYGLNEEQCTNSQLDWYEVWQQCRNEMLNIGNSQIRALLSELDLYNVEWKGYQTNFRIK